jgi:diacylglycerol kinase family enzyme
MTLAMFATITAAIALAIAVAAMSLAATITKRVGIRDPIAVPPFWRRVLRIRPMPTTAEAFSHFEGRDQRVAFIANPTKAGIAEVREQALRACSIRYLPQPMWLYTSEDDPGTGQTREALEAGADVVVAVGGDGTVRAVAEALAGTGVPLGILPIGTGNLFARNLDLPLGDVPGLLRTVLEGAEARIDVGWLDIERGDVKPGEPTRHLFLVMAGAGFDAEMVAGADDRLKRRVGWFAYFLAAVKHLGERRMTASVSVNGSEPITAQMRTVLLANVGSLPGGFTLIPDASVTDGRLDIATLDARAGIVGWTELFGSVVAQGAGLKQPEILKAYRASRIDHTRGEVVAIRMDQPQKVQVDGEALGRATAISAKVDAGALVVRVPATAPPGT